MFSSSDNNKAEMIKKKISAYRCSVMDVYKQAHFLLHSSAVSVPLESCLCPLQSQNSTEAAFLRHYFKNS